VELNSNKYYKQNMMSRFLAVLILVGSSFVGGAEEWIGVNDIMEWNVDNTGDSPGERVVAVLDAGVVGRFSGVELVGTVIDNNGNWGYNLPTVANFRLYVKFSEGQTYALEQTTKTNYITLGLRRVSNNKYHLTAKCMVNHTSMRVIFRKVIGSVNVSLGDPYLITTNGEPVISSPTYRNILSEKLGIGTYSPDFALDVVGTIRAHEIVVSKAKTADFVFEKDYNLRTLEEVDAFVKEHKHLPEIPSAQEMEKGGVNVAQMNKLLLQKVEELTLYTLEQEKKIVSQQKVIETQNSKLQKLDRLEKRMVIIENLLEKKVK
jgi:hypothetical protein